jgi:hypothetical protein
MKNSGIYIVGAVVLLGGGAYLFLKNKQSKDALKVSELADKVSGTTSTGTTSTGTTSTGTTSNLSTTSDGVSPSDANLNLANATVLVGKRAVLIANANQNCVRKPINLGGWGSVSLDLDYANCLGQIKTAKIKLVELDKELAKLGYKVDANGQLVKI